MFIANKVRLYPTPEQRSKIHQAAGSARYIYNMVLETNSCLYSISGESFNEFDANKYITKLKRHFLWLKDTHSQVLQASTKNAWTAYTNFFKGQAKFPKFKHKHNPTQSFQYPQGVKLDHAKRRIYLPKIGWVKARGFRPWNGKIKTVTVSFDTAGYYHASILLDDGIDHVVTKRTGPVIGIDMGVAHFATLSDGTTFELPPGLAKAQAKVVLRQKQHSNKQKASHNRRKSQKKLAKAHKRVQNIRKDFLHKLTKDLSENQAVVVEDLAIQKMQQRKASKASLNRDIATQSWGLFFTLLEYKLVRNGNLFLKVPPEYTSQRCPVCSYTSKANRRSQSHFCCRQCGHTDNADRNAAINILTAGMAGVACQQTSLS